MIKIMEELHADHGNLVKVLNILERQVEIFMDTGEPDYELMRDVVEYTRNYPDMFHHPKEDLIYERLKTRNTDIARAVGGIQAEHEIMARQAKALETHIFNVFNETEVPRGFVVGAARTYANKLRRHIQLEEAKFFPAATATLLAEDWMEIEAAAITCVDPLFGRELKDAYKELHAEIVRIDRQAA